MSEKQEPGTKKYRRKHDKICKNCGKPFRSVQARARVCSEKCRHDLWDERRSLIAAEERIMRALQTLEEAINDPLLAPLAYRLIEATRQATREVVIEADKSPYGKQLALFDNPTSKPGKTHAA